jgi:hypothetical protein
LPTFRVPESFGVKVTVLPEPTMVRDEVRPVVLSVEVAKVRFPVKEPWGRTRDETPLLMEEVATHVGTPFWEERTKPPVPMANLESVFAADA